MKKSVGTLSAILVIVLIATACTLPNNAAKIGLVSMSFGDSGGIGARAFSPTDVHTVTITVSGSGMGTISRTLTAPNLSTTLQVPAGSARTFAILARDAANLPIYRGQTTADIAAGSSISLTVSLAEIVYHTVTFVTNGGSAVAPISVESGSKITSPTTTRSGYSFTGWFKDDPLTDPWIFAVDTVTADINLMAGWDLIPTYTLSFSPNGGAGTMSDLDLETGQSTSLAPNAFTRLGYNFSGWNTSSDGSGTAYANGASFTMGGANVTLYAQWTIIEYPITYYLDGGSNDPGNPATYTVEDSFTLNDPTKADYAFMGWYSDPGFGTPVDDISLGTTGNLDLYAKWGRTITFDPNGGTGSMADQPMQPTAAEPLLPIGFTKPNSVFAGWATSPTAAVEYLDGDTYTMADANITLYARWAEELITDGTINVTIPTNDAIVYLYIESNLFTALQLTSSGTGPLFTPLVEVKENALATSLTQEAGSNWAPTEFTLIFALDPAGSYFLEVYDTDADANGSFDLTFSRYNP